MSADPNKKSARSFQCRDVLWETFEQMARELECSVDYLVNEAMKQYARQRGAGGSRTPHPGIPRTGDLTQGVADHPMGAMSAPPAGWGGSSHLQAPSGGLPPPPAGRVPPPPGRSGAAPPPPARGAAAAGRGAAAAVLPAGQRSVPPPLPRGPSPLPIAPLVANGFPAPATHPNTLSLIYRGERHPITKDRFVIGRGKQSSDLTLKDPNVSRQHAMIEFQNGVYFMVDMGSTNGVEHDGQRVTRRQIAEGDVFRICDHDITFTYH